MNASDLDIAYKYPFTSEAKKVVSEMNLGKIDSEMLKFGEIRVQEALNNGAIKYAPSPLLELKKRYVISYVYGRMLVSALNNRSYIGRYAIAEARRSSSALRSDSVESIMTICREVNLPAIKEDGLFSMAFTDFISNLSKNSKLNLSNQMLDKGLVKVDREELVTILEEAIYREIRKGLPIDPKSMPKEVAEHAKAIKIVLPEIEIKGTASKGTDLKRYAWIEKLMGTPIGDVRHRTVNLILAPYLTNVRGMSPESAAEAIVKYIDKCKEINPDTNVNETYISYQCRYAKNKGLRPMNFDRASDMLKGIVNLEEK